MKASLIVALILSCLLASAIIDPALAEIKVVGSILRTDVTPGQHVVHEITLSIGENDKPMDLEAGVFGFGQSPEGAYIALDPEEDVSPHTARPFFSITPSSFQVEPGSSQELILEGDIPQDAEGSLYALGHIYSNATGNGTVGISVAFLIPTLLTVSGTDIIDAGEITSMDIAEPVPSDQYNLSVEFENTGNHHYRVMANASLLDSDGNTLATGSVPSNGVSIIPSYSRLLKVPLSLDEELQPGDYRAVADVTREDGTLLDSEEIEFSIE